MVRCLFTGTNGGSVFFVSALDCVSHNGTGRQTDRQTLLHWTQHFTSGLRNNIMLVTELGVACTSAGLLLAV